MIPAALQAASSVYTVSNIKRGWRNTPAPLFLRISLCNTESIKLYNLATDLNPKLLLMEMRVVLFLLLDPRLLNRRRAVDLKIKQDAIGKAQQ